MAGSSGGGGQSGTVGNGGSGVAGTGGSGAAGMGIDGAAAGGSGGGGTGAAAAVRAAASLEHPVAVRRGRPRGTGGSAGSTLAEARPATPPVGFTVPIRRVSR
jgi:hypothetical protein